MTTATTVPIRRNTSAEPNRQTTVEGLCAQLDLVFRNVGISASRAKISRLVREYKFRAERNGFAFIDYIANRTALTAYQRRVVADELTRVIAYSDPTGETAVNNVMRQR